MNTPTRRPVLDLAAYDNALYGVRNVVGNARVPMPDEVVGQVVAEVLTAAGLLPPPPEPDPQTCTSMWPDETGEWWQCQAGPGHDPGERHNADEWGWPDSHPEAIPPTKG
ncbi:hypothetical protein OG858_47425 (plasmid) [Streptomyces europaeiscabiei]|uniref:hypothetical protein n=1 Tax=Streptomyces europaeiscabiei TaxID=146819 RepID=UPI002E811450|nr:hypothetical protein [Streptomyces europaeiscabiei]WUD38831.1 hypothetical protein OG858_47425 [Streptomyces europaeiscabiei]